MSQDDIIKQVLLFKDQGNQKFKDEKFFDAEVLYTKAIDLAPQTETKTLAILYTNRAFANYKLENYGSVLNDTTKAIKCDPTYFKAYYRRGSANLILGNYEDALNDFKKVVQMKPKDRESRDKLKQCKEALVLLHFSQAIENDDDRGGAQPVSVVLSDYVIEDDYKGPKMENDTLTLNFVLEMLEHFKNQKTIHKRHLFVILQSVKQHFEVLPNITRVTLNKEDVITVCGDVHGQFYDLLNLFNLNGTPSEKNQYLFNGDFVDRGSFSCEVIITLLAFKCLYPNHFFMSRGNHESKSLHKMYGFEGEVFQKYGEFAYNVFCDIFNLLPLGHLLNEKILVIHGGLFGKDGVKISDIDAVNRRGEPPVTGLMSDLLWADPQKYPGRMPSKRGVGSSFGPDVTKKFLDDNNLDLIIRSHEVRNEGYEVEHDGLLITVFSAPNYCDQFGNKGACIRINGELQKEFITFTHVPHPPIPPMAYASNLFNF